ncbi:hypothetical protein RB213_001606 [Colletotrichum asianum]
MCPSPRSPVFFFLICPECPAHRPTHETSLELRPTGVGKGGSFGGHSALSAYRPMACLLLLGCLSVMSTRTLVQVGRDFRPGVEGSPPSGFRRGLR